MKTTIEIPDDLYRQVKARSAFQGRTIREATAEDIPGLALGGRFANGTGGGRLGGPMATAQHPGGPTGAERARSRTKARSRL